MSHDHNPRESILWFANKGFPTGPVRPTIRSEMSKGKSQPTFRFAAVQQVRIVAWGVKQKQSIKNPEMSQICLNFFLSDQTVFLSGQSLSLA